MRVLGMDALDLVRIEGGFIIGGVEYDENVSPYECGLGWSVALDKEQFRGRDALAADRETARRRLISIRLEAGGAGASGAKLMSTDGEPAGLVTQAVESPFLSGATLGLGRVDRAYAAVGTELHAEVEGALITGTVVSHPVYEAERRRAKEL
jgi:aminomethyltransferase